MELNKHTLLEVAKRGIDRAQGNAAITSPQLAFSVAEYINDEFDVGAQSNYDADTGEYSVTIRPTGERPGHLIAWRFIRLESSYTTKIDHWQIDEAGRKSVGKEYDTIAKALRNDPEYLWSWFANIAVTLGDHSNLNGYECATSAAALIRHLWNVDITKHPHYIAQLDRTKPSPKHVTREEAFADPETNHVYINVTGFGPDSGATAIAKRINLELQGQGFTSFLHVADTTLSQDQVSDVTPKETVFSITAVESRGHTDQYSAEEDPGVTEADDAFGEGEDPLDSDDPDGTYGNEEEGVAYGCAIGASFQPPHELELELQDHDSHPVLTIQYFQENLPGTVVKAKYKVDSYLMDAIHDMHFPKKTVHVTVDPSDPDPVATVEMIKDAVLKADAGQPLQALDYKLSLDDPEQRQKAYMLQLVGSNEVAIMHVDTEAPEFDIGTMYLNNVDVVDTSDYNMVHYLLTEYAPAGLEYINTLIFNNQRLVSKYGTREAYMANVTHDNNKPFTLYDINQKAIPQSIYGLVESCWTDWQQTARLEELGNEIGDMSVVIPFEKYETKTQGGFMVVREHPRLAELFLKLLKARAQHNKLLELWLKTMGR